jgi:sulfur-carrier protein adenylyltransferase/sulfurtransferase
MQPINTLFEDARPSRAGYRDVSPEAAYRERGAARLVDVREAAELADTGFIPGAEHAPLATVEERAARWNKDEDIILICRSGGRSGRAAEILVRHGFCRVMNMTGGMNAYLASGLPVARS